MPGERGCQPGRAFCNTAAMTSKDRKRDPGRPAYAGKQPRRKDPAPAAAPVEKPTPPAGPPGSPWAMANAAVQIRRLHKVAVGSALIIAPLLATAGQALLIPVRGSGSSALANVAGQLGAWRAAHGFLLVYALLMLVALLGLGRLLHTRDQVWGTGGTAVAVIGLLAALGITIVDLVVAEMAALGGGGQLDALLERVGRLLYWLDLTEDLLMFGLVLLLLGLLRTRSVPPWAVILALTGLALPYATPTMLVVAFALQFLGLGWIGLTVLRRPDEDWASPPEYGLLPRPLLTGILVTALFLPGAVTAPRFLAFTSVAVALLIYRPRPDPAPAT
jgi:hypothetical protein